ncbi:hypothetical protein Ga0451573_002612 [Peptococcaceae bacterium DYL19]|nr:hypothetical protein [Phosphitispora fastidiosa]
MKNDFTKCYLDLNLTDACGKCVTRPCAFTG